MKKLLLVQKTGNANGINPPDQQDNLIAFQPSSTIDNDNSKDIDNQWLLDHDAYAEALNKYRELRTEIEKAIGIKKDFDRQGPVHVGIITQELMDNLPLYGLLNQFEDAVIRKTKAKEKL